MLSAVAAGAQTPPRTSQDAQSPTEVERGETVNDRRRPDYDPVGVRLGGFMLYPELGLQESYNSNVYATRTNEKSDFITSIEPALDLRSNWNNHALNLHADARAVRYADYNSENFTDYTLSADGRVDVLRDFRLFAGAGYQLRHEPRSSPDNQGGTEPTEYSVTGANLGAEKEFNRLSFRLDGKAEQYEYDNVRNAAGTVLDQSGRDRDQYEMSLKTGYEIAPLRRVYLLTSYNTRDYDKLTGGFNRDSDGYLVAAGAEYDLTGLIFLDAYAGYRRQDYDDARLGEINGWASGVKVTWNVTRLTTITGTLDRDIEETTQARSPGYFQTKAELRADHELLRNLILTASLGYQNDDFQGISRNDDYYLAGLGAKYLINRNFSLSGGYGYRSRESSVSNSDFDENVVMLRLSSHL
ncbi:outer membrane beta-barrel protein [Ferrovibrio terrae]|uniref:outer membrane beta-barrel protein n=1 Tax=Ferrovibrio terrae TaxID=2594003 RepID=UPI0031382758